MWKVTLSDKAETEFKNDLLNNRWTADDLKILKAWCGFVEYYGPQALARDYKWDDHPLWGQWEGCRSSCISNSGRIIYKINDSEITVLVLRITANHNYR